MVSGKSNWVAPGDAGGVGETDPGGDAWGIGGGSGLFSCNGGGGEGGVVFETAGAGAFAGGAGGRGGGGRGRGNRGISSLGVLPMDTFS